MKTVTTGNLRRSFPDQYTWRQVLEDIFLSTVSQTRSLDDIESNAMDLMQTAYPGNYTIKALYDVDEQAVRFKLIFNTPADETFFKLKYE